MSTSYAAMAAYNPDAYKIAIVMHAHRMHERYRQERLRALHEDDDNPFDERHVYMTAIKQLYPEWKEGK